VVPGSLGIPVRLKIGKETEKKKQDKMGDYSWAYSPQGQTQGITHPLPGSDGFVNSYGKSSLKTWEDAKLFTALKHQSWNRGDTAAQRVYTWDWEQPSCWHHWGSTKQRLPRASPSCMYWKLNDSGTRPQVHSRSFVFPCSTRLKDPNCATYTWWMERGTEPSDDTAACNRNAQLP
jgi:hypothetical protein